MKEITKIETIVTRWLCGAEGCKTEHRSQGAAERCPARSAAISAERRAHCPNCHEPLQFYGVFGRPEDEQENQTYENQTYEKEKP